jgi:hypothetical protein
VLGSRPFLFCFLNSFIAFLASLILDFFSFFDKALNAFTASLTLAGSGSLAGTGIVAAGKTAAAEKVVAEEKTISAETKNRIPFLIKIGFLNMLKYLPWKVNSFYPAKKNTPAG